MIMLFNSPQELVEFFNTLDLNESTLVFKDKEKTKTKKDCACEGKGACQCGPKKVEESYDTVEVSLSNDSIIVESFSDDPVFNLTISEESDNIFYVKEYVTVPDTCGTGKIVLEDRETFMNMCEMENKATVDLNIVVEGKRYNNITFTLEQTTGTPYLQLSKDHIK